MLISASQTAWAAAGSPAHEHAMPANGCCATCGAALKSGVSIARVETPTTSGHADLFRFGGEHVCEACAWLFGAGKGRPGNYIAYGDKIEYVTISLESVVADKRPWLHVLREIADLHDDTPIAGVMTTDVKPRLWHRVNSATIGDFGLYVHCLDYDVSEFRRFDLRACLDAIAAIIPALRVGFSKASVYFGLWRDYARASRDIDATARFESAIAPIRTQPHFLPALIAAGVTKGDKQDVKPRRPDRDDDAAATSCGAADANQSGLFQ